MAKEIDQLDLSTAKEIYKWLIPSKEKIKDEPENVFKARVRAYLRENKLTPYQALEKISKLKRGMPSKLLNT